MEDFEVCVFCGEVFKGKKIKNFHSHYEKCRDNYNENDDNLENDDFYLYGDNG